jgi:flagellar biosynthesis protein FlhA
VTRAASGTDLGSEVTSQMLLNPRVLGMVSAILGGSRCCPGCRSCRSSRSRARSAGSRGRARAQGADRAGGARGAHRAGEGGEVGRAAPLDLLELEVGYELVPLVDAAQRGELIERIKSLRRQLAQEMGFVVPPVHIRDNLQLKPGEYAILLKGVELQRAEIRMGQYLAINPAAPIPSFRGVPTKEPAFGLDALWVLATDREQAQLAGYTVVDAATGVVTHLTEVIRATPTSCSGARRCRASRRARQEQSQGRRGAGAAAAHARPGAEGAAESPARARRHPRLPLDRRDARRHAPTTKDPHQLTEHVRAALSRSIVNRFLSPDRVLPLVTLSPRLEKIDRRAVHRTEDGRISRSSRDGAAPARQARTWAEQFALQGHQPLVLCSTSVRGHLRRLTERFLPSLAVVAPGEIPANVKIHSLGVVSLEDEDREATRLAIPRPTATATVTPAAAGAA